MNHMARVARSLLIFSIGMGIPCRILAAQDVNRANEQKDVTTDQGKELRDVFVGKETASAPSHRTIGRLGILLATGENLKQVRPDYSFRSGDHFYLEVTANRDGWLYVLHAAPGGSLKQLWPRRQDDNTIKSGQTYQVPPKPGVFIFDKDVGQEYFYVAIRPNQTPPKLDALPAQKPLKANSGVEKAPSKKGTSSITNFVVRDPFGEAGRGVVFDPGEEDGDPYLYFSAVAEDNLNSAMIEFRLSHAQ
jgi:Domain of unknown function (DUF4384)